MALDLAADIYEITLGGPWVVAGTADPRTGGGFVAPLNSLYLRTGTTEWYQKTDAANTAWTPWGAILGTDGVGYYGTGSDGVLTVAGTTTLGLDTWATTVTVQNGGRLNTNGYRLMATTSITVDVGGIIAYDGNNAVTFNGGVAGNTAGTVPNGTVGAVGNTGAGATATSGTYLITGSGNGGAGGAGTSAGGAGGVVTGLAATAGGFRNLPQFVWASELSAGATALTGSRGGGGGGGDGVNRGGGGGGGAGCMVLAAPIIANSGSIQTTGGSGAAGVAGNAGGGGGGGGGHIFLLTPILTGNAATVAGGAGGAGSGTGNPGVSGNAGSVFRVPV